MPSHFRGHRRRDAILLAIHAGARTIRDICQAVGLRSTSTLSYHLASLEEAGLVLRGRKDPRHAQRATCLTPWGEAQARWLSMVKGSVS